MGWDVFFYLDTDGEGIEWISNKRMNDLSEATWTTERGNGEGDWREDISMQRNCFCKKSGGH
jgi:hypothetical protein